MSFARIGAAFLAGLAFFAVIGVFGLRIAIVATREAGRFRREQSGSLIV